MTSSQGHWKSGAVLLLGKGPPALAAARALAATGCRIIAGDGGEAITSVERSRTCSEIWRHPPPSEPDRFVTELAAYLTRRSEITVVLPVDERYVALLAGRRDRWPRSVIVAMTDPVIVETCLDKSRMYQLAREVGVPFAALERVHSRSDLTAAADAVGYPCVIRPVRWVAPMPQARKAVICPDRETVERVFAAWPAGHTELLVQRYVSGPRQGITFAAREGRLLASVHTTVLRTDRVDGTGVIAYGVTVAPDPRLTAYCEALLERLSYTGIGGMQFVVPSTGEPSFLELNPRLSAGYAVIEHCGLPLTEAAVELAIEDSRWDPGPLLRYPVGVRFAWTSRDLYGLGMAMSRREIGMTAALRWLTSAIRDSIRADVHLTWSRHDPGPTLAVYAHLATLGPWRSGKRAQRRRW